MKASVIKLSIYLFALVLISGSVCAQTQKLLPCGNGPLDSALVIAHPEILVKMDSLEAFTQRFIANQKSGQATSRSSSDTSYEYTIPVVFHIIHNYGAEDITDTQVIDEVRILNEDYNKLNPDTTAIIPQFKSIAANNHMTFKLAQIDPNGDCTTGIEHIHDLITYDGGDGAKLDDWPRNEYLNIWAVEAIKIGSNDVAGYAYFPSEVDGVFGAPYDGVIILSNFVGSIGTGTAYTSRAVTHEIGHTMNLEHPWGFTNSPNVACGDDNVFDTPITEGSQVEVCNLNLSLCNPPVIENVQNYMDYSYCSKMFTNGQKARIEAALNSTQSDRTTLWSSANLAATGVDGSVQPGLCKPKADFSVNNRYTCQGTSVSFTDFSWRGTETGRTWTFSNGTPATSILKNPTVTFNDTGWQSVTLIASNINGSDTLVQQNYVHVSPSTADYKPPFVETFNDSLRFANKWFVSNLENDTVYNRPYIGYNWRRVNYAGYYGGNTSVELYNFNDFNGDYKDLISPSFDLSAGGTYELSFVYTGASQTTNSTGLTDMLKIYVTASCGDNWFPLTPTGITGLQLANSGLWPTSYVPTSNSVWSFYSLNVPSSFNQKNVRFKFEYTSGGSGNNFYMDNVAVNIATGIPQLNAQNLSLKVFPDPAGESATVSYHLTEDDNVKIDLTDISGRLISEPVNTRQTAGDYNILLDNNTIGNLADGIYIIRLWIDGASVTKKLVVAKN